MLNYIWFGLMAIALVVAAFNGTADAVTKGAVESATSAVRNRHRPGRGHDALAGDDAGGRGVGARVGGWPRAAAVLRWLFPEVPADHPAAGAIVLALAANMLGLNNAATPLGIKAMEELQTLNQTRTPPQRDGHAHGGHDCRRAVRAGIDDRCAHRRRRANPTAIIAPTIVATFIGTSRP